MSHSGEQGNPYAQQPPPPQGPQPGNPYGQVPQQQNPYAQQQGGPQGAYGYPAAPPSAPPMAGGPGTPGPVGPGGYGVPGQGGPGGPGGSGKGVPAWLWAVGGAVVASAVWAGTLFATGGFGSQEPVADLRGYTYKSDLCSVTSWTPFEDARFDLEDSNTSSSSGENPEASGVQHAALDSMWCNADLVQPDADPDDYASTFVYTKAFLHKKSDPAPEFAAQYSAYEQQKSSIDYKVAPVQGIGDEAYLVTRSESAGSSESKSSYVILGIRDGWMTYEITWSSYSTSDSSSLPGNAQVSEMLQSSAKETLAKLKG